MNPDFDARDPEATVRAALEGAGIKYQVQAVDRERPYAVFTVRGSDPGELFFSAMVLGPTLRLVVHQALPGPADVARLWHCNEVNLVWGFGRVFFNAASGSYDVAAGLDCGDGVPPADAVRFALQQLVAGVNELRGGRVPAFSYPPAAGGPVTTSDLVKQLDAMGLTSRATNDGSILEVPVAAPSGTRFVVQAFVPDGALLVLRGQRGPERVTAEDERAIRAIHEINGRSALGTVALWPGAGRVLHQVLVPLAWSTLDARLLRRLFDQVGAVMLAIDREL